MENLFVKITQVFQNLFALLEKPKVEIKFKTITQDSLRKQIGDTQMFLKSVDAAWSELKAPQLEELYSRVCLKLKSEPALTKSLGSPTIDLLLNMPSELKSRANHLGVIKSIDEANKIITRLMDELEDNVGKIISDEAKGVVINDVKLSHGLFLGVLQAAKMFAEFNCYFLAVMGHILTSRNGVITLPRYAIDYLCNNGEQYIQLVNHVCNVSGRYSIINEITRVKEKGLDFKFSVAADSTHVRQIFSTLGIENIFLSIFSLFIRPIALIGEVYVDMRHSYYQGVKEKKKWLESHTALIKLELEGADPNSPKYVETQKMITYYEDKIAELDKKVQSYGD